MSTSMHITWREPLAIVLLVFGGFLFGLGWILGLALLWGSGSWTAAEKRIGTLVPIAEIILVGVLIASTSSGSGATSFTVGDGFIWAAIIALLATIVGAAMLLAVRLGRSSSS